MIGLADTEKLLRAHCSEPVLLSLFLWVPADPAQLRELPARADELFDLAARDGADGPVRVGAAERQTVRELISGQARNWLGQSVAIFACADIGLTEVFPLPVRLQERAVLGTRPHVRPLLATIWQHPSFRAVVADRRHGWLFSVDGDQISETRLPDAEIVRSHGFSGWYGLAAYRTNERVIELARHHYRDIADLLDQAVSESGPEPLVIGGHRDSVAQVLAALPARVRNDYAGSFAADPDTLTPAKVRQLADGVVADWLRQRDEQLLTQFREQPPGRLAATGLTSCIAAAAQHATRVLAVPSGGLIPGYSCRHCGALSSEGYGCSHGREAALAVPDLIDELAVRALSDGAQVATLTEPPAGIAALLRFPLTSA